MEPYKLAPPLRQSCAVADRLLESIADIVMKVVMLCSSRAFSKMYFWRCRVAASQPRTFMTGNLISRRTEVFRGSDGNKPRKSLWRARSQSAASCSSSCLRRINMLIREDNARFLSATLPEQNESHRCFYLTFLVLVRFPFQMLFSVKSRLQVRLSQKDVTCLQTAVATFQAIQPWSLLY